MIKRVTLTFLQFLSDKFDVLAALGGLAVTPVIWFRVAGQKDIAIVIFLGCLLYLLLRKKLSKQDVGTAGENSTLKNREVVKPVIYCIFTLVWATGLLLYSSQLYNRPFMYFVTMAILGGLITIQILLHSGHAPVWPVLVQIFMLGLTLRAETFYVYPSLFGSDTFWHARVIEMVSATGKIQSLESVYYYAQYPVFHLLSAATHQVTSLHVEDSMFLSVGLTSMIIIMLVYYITKDILNTRVSLLATLLASVSLSIVYIAADIVPDSLVLSFFVTIVYLLIKRGRTVIGQGTLLFISLVMVITHQLSTFVTAISTAALFAGERLARILGRSQNGNTITITYMFLFFVSILAYWMYSYRSSGLTIFEWAFSPLVSRMRSLEFGAETSVTVSVQYSLWTNFLFHFGYLLLLFPAIGGMLYLFSNRNAIRFTLGFTPLLLFFFIYAIPAFGVRNFLPGRWFPFQEVFLSIVAAVYLMAFWKLMKPQTVKMAALSFFIMLIVFFNITSPEINKDNPFYATERAIVNRFTEAEIASVKAVSNWPTGRIDTDMVFGSFIVSRYDPEVKISPFSSDFMLEPVQQENEKTLVVLRETTRNRPIEVVSTGTATGKRRVVVNDDFFRSFSSARYNLVYASSGGVLGYQPR